jgi:rhodanese-related sulfurtransferase
MFHAKRIPGSIRFKSLKHALNAPDPKEEFIVYCLNSGCTAGVVVHQQLVDYGFQNLRHKAGGVTDWEDAGDPLEGDYPPVTI